MRSSYLPYHSSRPIVRPYHLTNCPPYHLDPLFSRVLDQLISSGLSCFPSCPAHLFFAWCSSQDLAVDDVVLTANKQYSAIHMFSHQFREAVNPFVQLTTERGHELRLTSGHYVYVNNSLMQAGKVHVGDVLEDADGIPVTVTKTSVVVDTGLFNPHTMDGDVVVVSPPLSLFYYFLNFLANCII